MNQKQNTYVNAMATVESSSDATVNPIGAHYEREIRYPRGVGGNQAPYIPRNTSNSVYENPPGYTLQTGHETNIRNEPPSAPPLSTRFSVEGTGKLLKFKCMV